MLVKSFTASTLMLMSLILSPTLAHARTAFGPGVTSGGDSCKQQVFRSFDLLKSLFENGKIDLSNLQVPQEEALSILSKVTFQFDQNLQKDGRPVEMLNVFGDNIIIVDRKICNIPQEPLSIYTPLLLHEVIRLMGLDDGPDYRISNRFQNVIGEAVAVATAAFVPRKFQILPWSMHGNYAIAWGLDNEDLNFDALLDLTPQEEQQFLNDHWEHMINYLVYVPTMTVLDVMRNGKSEPEPIYWMNSSVSNHNSVWLIGANSIFMVYGAGKWTGSMETLYAIEVGQNNRPNVLAICREECLKKTGEAAYNAMTPQQRAEVAKWPMQSFKYEFVSDRYGGGDAGTWYVTFSSFQSKTDNGITLKAEMTISYGNDGFEIEIKPFKKIAKSF
jgi:hypothetical protein